THKLPLGEILFLIGFFLIFFLEYVLISHNHSHQSEEPISTTYGTNNQPLFSTYSNLKTPQEVEAEQKNQNQGLISIILTLVLSVHSVIGGLTTGIANT